ncbi:hypothetical protein E8E11_000957 [Didymella keratinophila]|nr:hypothetical protein E8E11_000957 [Didymella keratinophila]
MRAYATAEDDMEIGEIMETVGDFYSLVSNEDKPKSFESVPLEECQPVRSAVIPCHEADYNVPNNVLNTSHREFALESNRVDSVIENLHASDSVRATGFVGMSSEVRWLQSVAVSQSQKVVNCVEPYSQEHEYDLLGLQASSFAYWADSASIGSTEINIDPHELPSTGLAQKLLSCYMLKVHASFPILARTTFESQFRKYFTALEHGNPPRLSPKWQANLNFVFAISATYASPTDAERNTNKSNHRVFQARAQALTLDTISSMGPADVPRIQNLGLSAFYCLCIGQVSR